MKKVMLGSFILFILSGTFVNAQTSTSTSIKPIKLGSDMRLVIPNDQELVYVYEVDASELRFKSTDDRERYFTSMKDDVASYRIDREAGKVYLVLDRDYIAKHKWTANEVNTHFVNRSTYMKDQYGNYVPPAEK